MPFLKHKVIRYAVRAVLALSGLLVISSALILWRLSTGPIQLNNLTPSIRNIVSSLPGNFAVQIGEIELVWDRQLNTLQLRVSEVALVGDNGVRIVAAPTANISISISALMNRVIALSAIELHGVSVHLIRNEDGSMQFGQKTSKVAAETSKPDHIPAPPPEFQDLTEMLLNTIKVLESTPDPKHPLSFLKTVNLRGEFTAENRKLGMEFQFADIDFSFRGQDNGIAGDLTLLVDGPEAVAGIKLDISLMAKGADISADVDVNGVNISALSRLGAGFDVLSGVDLTLNGTLSGTMTLPETIHSLELDASGGAGSISLDRFIPDPIDIRALNLKAKIDPTGRNLELSELSLSLGNENSSGPKLLLSGVASKTHEIISIAAKTSLEQLEIKDLEVYWPADLVPGTRTWLTDNLKDGTVDKVSLDINMTLPSARDGAVALEKLEGEISYSNLSVYFYSPLPPATGVIGNGTFNEHGFDLSIHKGVVEGINIGPGKVQITGLDINQVALDVKTPLAGEVAKALALLELPPFGLDKVIGFGSADVGGHFTADLGISLPLKSGMLPAEIDYHVAATLTGASVRNIFGGLGLANGSLDIYDDFSRLGINGTLELAGIPVSLQWDSSRIEGGTLQSTIHVGANEIKAADINRLGFPVDKYFSGSFAAELDAKTGTGGGTDISISTDLDRSGLTIPAINWNKPPGEEGKVSAAVSISGGKKWNINDFSIEAGTLSASGEADYDQADSTLELVLDSVRVDRTFLQDLKVSTDPEQGTRISVTGGELDLEPILTAYSSQANTGDKDADTTTKESQEAPVSSPATLRLDIARLDKIFFSQDRFLKDISADLEYSNGGWQYIQINGQNPFSVENDTLSHSRDDQTQRVPGEFSFNFGPAADGQYPLSVRLENLGSLLATTLDSHMLSGGQLVIDGNSSGALLTAPVSVSAKLDGFTVLEAPLLAQVLSFSSLRQTLNTLNSEGLIIDSFFGDLLLSGDNLSSDLLRAHGGSVGATIKGSMALDEGAIDLQGSVIPLHKISNVAGKIPLLKHVLVGDDGEGIVALDYAVTGSFDKPDVKVNPGSLLTPGVLRDLFNHDKTKQ
jgi:hypothetical protein